MAFEKVGVEAVIIGVDAFVRGTERMRKGVTGVGESALSTKERTEVLSGALKNVGLVMTAAAVAATAFFLSAVKLAARVETLGVVTVTLGKNVGKTEEEIRALEQAIVDEGITLQTARKAIALMIQSNIDLGNATDLATEAQNAAVIAGVNSSEAFERLVFTITSGNVRMARTLGLQVNFQRAYKRTAQELGILTTELTELDKVTARTNEVIAAGANIAHAYDAAMETVGKKVTSLDRLLEESKRAMGEAWLPVYADVVDFITKTLKSWLSLSDAHRGIISSTLGMITAFVGIVGVLALIGSKLPGAIAGFKLLATAVAGSGSFLFSATQVFGIFIVAILAVGVAIVKLIKFINMVKAGFKSINDAVAEQNERMFNTARSFEEYREEMERVGRVTKRVVGTQQELDEAFQRGEITTREYEKAIVIATEGLFEAELLTRELTEGTSKFAEGVATADRNMLKFARGMEKVAVDQDKLKAKMEALSETMDIDLTESFTDFRTEIGDTKTEIADLLTFRLLTTPQKEDLLELARKFLDAKDNVKLLQRAVFTLNSQPITTEEQRQEIRDTRTDLFDARTEVSDIQKEMKDLTGRDYVSKRQQDQLRDLVENLDDVEQKWDTTTKSIIFDLAEQRLAIDGFTKEEIKALQKLAGPEGLGLVDEAGAALIEKIGAFADAMDEAGDQAGIFGEDMLTLQQMLLDPTITIEELADQIDRIRSKTVTITILTIEEIRRKKLPETEEGDESGLPASDEFGLPALANFSALQALAAPAAAAPLIGHTFTRNITQNLTVNTNAPVEPIIADFRALESMASAF